GVDRDRGLAGLAIADDQLALAAADGDERVDRLEARLHRLADRLARDDARRLDLDAAALVGDDRALAVDRIAEPVDHTAEQALAGLRELSLGAEIGDLVADDLRNLCGADVHVQPFIALASAFKRVRMEESIICEPIRTTSPPSRSGSTQSSTVTSRPTRWRS